jgi:hypothetical protein
MSELEDFLSQMLLRPISLGARYIESRSTLAPNSFCRTRLIRPAHSALFGPD